MVLHVLQGALAGEQITTSFCDASDTTTVCEPLVSDRRDDACDVAAAPLAEPTGGAPQAANAMHAMINELWRSNRVRIGRNEL